MHHLFDPSFSDKFRKLVEGRYKRYGYFEYDTEGEIERYKVGFSSARRARGEMRTHTPRRVRCHSVNSFLNLAGIGGEVAPFRH